MKLQKIAFHLKIQILIGSNKTFKRNYRNKKRFPDFSNLFESKYRVYSREIKKFCVIIEVNMGSKFKYNFSKKLLMKVNKLTDSCE
jgi:hypothetical protein